MAGVNVAQKLLDYLNRYRYAALVLVLGLGLMMLPGFPGEPSTESANPLPTEAQTPEHRLEQILSCVAGAGEVRVLLSVTQGEETAYQTDTDIGATDQRSDTVTVTDRDRNQTGLVVRVDPPVYLGAVVVCQGADDPQVRLAIVEAVSKYTGLRANQISVLKMK